MKKRKKRRTLLIPEARPMSMSTNSLANGSADPMGNYTGVPLLFPEPEQDADDL